MLLQVISKDGVPASASPIAAPARPPTSRSRCAGSLQPPPQARVRGRGSPCARALGPVSTPRPLTLKQPAESSSGLIGGETSRGGATRASPPGMISAPRQLNSAPPAGPTSPGDHVGACAHVHQRGCRTGCGKVRKLRGRRDWAIVAVRTKAAPPAPLRARARRVSHSPPRENLLLERSLRVTPGGPKHCNAARYSTRPCLARSPSAPHLPRWCPAPAPVPSPGPGARSSPGRRARGNGSGR